MRPRTSARAKRFAVPAVIALAVVSGVTLNTVTAVAAITSPSSTVVAAPERDVDQDATFYATLARAVKPSAEGKVDTSLLDTQLANLRSPSALPESSVTALTRLVRASSSEVISDVAAVNARIAAEQAAAAEAQAAAEAAARAAEIANSPDGARATAASLAASQYGWGADQFSCLDSLWTKESNWNYQAYNADGGATGIPQALPGSKMAAAGSDWQTTAATQVAWGLGYISSVYGSPCSAWGHSQSVNWY